MTAEVTFIDTNILLYAHDRSAGHKRDIASALLSDLWRSRSGALSTQVLQEFYVTVTRKIAKPLTPDSAVALLEEFKVFPTVQVDYPLIVSGIEVSLAYGISYWDGTIVAAAGALGAPVLMTEDLNDGQSYGAVRVVNPFRDATQPDRGHEP